MININQQLFEKKYQKGDETFEQMCDRVAFTEEQSEFMKQGILIAGGRHLRARGNEENLTLFNCYVIPIRGDSREAIQEFEARTDEITSKGGGIGTNWTVLRPKGSIISMNGGASSGSISFLKRYAYGKEILTQGGERRGANMATLHVAHPDILEFIDAKANLDVLNNVNISVWTTDNFMYAVLNNEPWNLIFPDFEKYKKLYDEEWDGDLTEWTNKNYPVKVYATVSAKELYEKICHNAWLNGEPGLLFEDTINRTANVNERILATNPCGEICLPANTSCNLLHINLLRLVREDRSVDWDLFSKAIKVGVEYGDMAIDAEKYFDPIVEVKQKFYRQIGLGVLGFADMLIKIGITYGSVECLRIIDKIGALMLNESYLASSELAGGVIRHIPSDIILDKRLNNKVSDIIRSKGMKNVNTLTVAPTGSTAMLLGTSGGIEPNFSFVYYRNDIMGERKITVDVVSEAPNEECLVSSMDISAEDHIRVQAQWQKWIDASISKTINLSRTATIDDVSNAYMMAWDLKCKGTTIYRDGSREGVLNLAPKKHNEFEILYNNNNEVIPDGVKVPMSIYAKRTKIKTGRKKYYFITGFASEEFKTPIELFILTNSSERTLIADELTNRMVELLKNNGIAEFLVDKLINNSSHQTNVDKISRAISMGLRHNINIQDIVLVLDEFTESMSSLLYRLKKHLMSLIPENTEYEEHTCPECNNKLIYTEGCISCKSCGYSKC